MTITALRAAKHLGKYSKWKYTHLEIQKLLYLSHMFHLQNENGRALIENSFEAWEWGPVHPDLYYQLRTAGADPISKTFLSWKNEQSLEENSSEVKWLNYIAGCFPPGSGAKLLEITHNDQSAWKQYYKRMMNIRIPSSAILKEYRDQVDASKRK